jgi:hypothetical protein
MRIAAVAVAFVLAGCAGGPEFAAETPEPPRDCEQFAGSAGRPVFKDDEDFRIIAGRYAHRLATANNRLNSVQRCLRDVRTGGTK